MRVRYFHQLAWRNYGIYHEEIISDYLVGSSAYFSSTFLHLEKYDEGKGKKNRWAWVSASISC